jgi:predicted flap endonuclease-1-like 5' DNA nuclease
MTDLKEIEGIGPAHAAALQGIGINSVEELLEKGAHTKDRENIAEQTGLTYAQILKWVNRADQMRITGIGSEYSDLLEFAGVDTVVELARRRADNLTAKMAERDQTTDQVRRLPTEAEVADWIAQAKQLPRKVWYEARSRRLRAEVENEVLVVPPIEGTAEEAEAPPVVIADATVGSAPPAAGAATAAGSTTPPGEEPTVIMPLSVAERLTPASPPAPVVPLTPEPPPASPVLPFAGAGAATVGAAAQGAAAASSEEKNAEPVVVPPSAAATPPDRPGPVTPAAVPAAADEEKGIPSWFWAIPLLLIPIGLFYFLWQGSKRQAADTSPVAVVTGAPAGTPAPGATPGAATALVVPADRKAEDVLMLCEKGAVDWLKESADAYNEREAGNVRILTASLGSREGRDQILYDKDQVKPALWVPADIYWTEKLTADAADEKIPAKSGATIEAGLPILKTYLVIAMREDRAQTFAKAAAGPYKGKTWALLGDIATKGWTAAGGDAAWGKLKLAQTDPTKSNSGMTALSLMYAEFRRANPTKDYNSAEFKTFMGNVQSAVATFPESTTDVVKAFVDKPGDYDAVIAYESDIIKAVEGGVKGIRVIYPSPTATIVMPAAVVRADWVNEDQTRFAEGFIKYLLQEDVQEKAVKYGYRPADAALMGVVTPAFEAPARRSVGMVAAPNVTGSETTSQIKEGLIFLWDGWKKAK